MKNILLRLFGLVCVLLGSVGLLFSVVVIWGFLSEHGMGFDLVFPGSVFGISLLIFYAGVSLLFVKKPADLESLVPGWVKVLGGVPFVLMGVYLVVFGPESSSTSGAIIFIVLGLSIIGYGVKRDAR